MKGLIRRDLYLNKKSLLIMLLMLIVVAKMSYDAVGNAEDLILSINAYTFMLVFSLSAMVEYIIYSDKKSKWDLYIYACPIKKETIVAEKYILDLLFLCIGSFSAILFIIIFDISQNINVSLGQMLGVIYSVSIILLNSSFNRPITYKFGATIANIFTTILIICVLALVIFSFIYNPNNMNKEMDYILNFFTGNKVVNIPIICLIIYIGSYKISTKCFEKYWN